MIDNREIEKVLEKLESCEDQELAVMYLKKFNAASKRLGQLLLNLDQSLSHEDWKRQCDQAKIELENIIGEIENLS